MFFVVAELYTVQKNTEGPDVVYFNVDFPWPLDNRDVSFGIFKMFCYPLRFLFMTFIG